MRLDTFVNSLNDKIVQLHKNVVIFTDCDDTQNLNN